MQVEQFREQGFLILRGMVSPVACDVMLAVTAEHLRGAVAPLEYEAEVGYPGAPATLDAPGGKTIRRLRGAYQRHACFRLWAEDPRLIAMLEQLLDEPVVLTLAHHNCVMTKHRDYGTATGWHRDIRYWSFTKPDLISAWLALGPENETNGGLRVIPGSHRIPVGKHQLDELDFLKPEVEENQRLFEQGVTLDLEKGDVLLFHSGLFHSAGTNTQDAVKMSLVFAYHGKSNAPVPGTRSSMSGEVPLG